MENDATLLHVLILAGLLTEWVWQGIVAGGASKLAVCRTWTGHLAILYSNGRAGYGSPPIPDGSGQGGTGGWRVRAMAA